MVETIVSERKKIIDKLINYAKKKLPPKQFTLIKSFISLYYATVPLEDLIARSIDDLYGAALSHWELMYTRAPNEYKRHIFNPQANKHHWQTSHTVLQLIAEDQPFLVDTLVMEINRKGFSTHMIVHLGGIKVVRNKKHQIVNVWPFDAEVEEASVEAPIYIELDKQTDPEVLEDLAHDLDRVIHDARMTVHDWKKMREEMYNAIAELDSIKAPLDPEEVKEAKDYLRWLLDDHMTFLGFRDYRMEGTGDNKALVIVPNSGLGVLRDESTSKVTRYYSELPKEARKQALSKQILIISKTNTRATVHSPRYTDYIGVKRFNKAGEVIGERRFIGLYTSTAYHCNSKMIPVIRRKVNTVLEKAKLPSKGHAAKTLVHILETLPRDDLFQATVEELYDLAMGIFQLQDRRRIRLFVRKDAFARFISCLVYVPRDNYNSDLRIRMQEILLAAFNGLEASFETSFSESALARIHFTIRTDPHHIPAYNLTEIEKKLIEAGRSWKDDLQESLLLYFGEEKGNELINRYRNAFPAGYREVFSANAAVVDINHIERLSPHRLLVMSFYRPANAADNSICFKLFRANHTIPLSDVMPILESMGLRVIGEQPYEIIFKDNRSVWINEFHMQFPGSATLDIEKNREIFQDAFEKIWYGEFERDYFNKLVLGAQLNWREISVIRAYAKYLKQIGFTFSQDYMEDTLAANAVVVALLIKLFHYRFDPNYTDRTDEKITNLMNQIDQALDSVTNVDEDRILSMYLNLIMATVRTNYYQVNENNNFKPYFAFKFNPDEISELPLPKPKYEIFVYSPRFEGIHLRMGKVARGGIRWSDRREDFRTEVLGLMKAQQVKNAIIVPAGAKGGFVPKYLPVDGNREAIMDEAISCYKNFMRGLLDLTDNLKSTAIIPPQNTVRYDEDDPYLVVAADKGTATFSDIANTVAKEYEFWLGDAFASGGHTGYDHKKMAITARGVWESVKNHFQELTIDMQNQDFTVVGIGDMSGDVFGNGMLLSDRIQLVGAFNHQHIFVDPHPNAKKSFLERKRLFNLPRSTWEDYNPELISKGGGVYRRSLKCIKLSTEVKNLFNIKKDQVTPNELIRAILKAPVDLLWNGGIGTFVKAVNETNLDAADRTNDNIRINGDELNCKAVGEGGNLGFTQLARIEYEMNGGKINTDFIDNSAGVNCSDHEVNIKILLNDIVAVDVITEQARNKLLAAMTEDVIQLVLQDNYRQTRALTIAKQQSQDYFNLYRRFIADKVEQGLINPTLEFLPDDKALMDRKALGKGLTRPELAVLSAYSKILLKQDILASDLMQDTYLQEYIKLVFPKVLQTRYEFQLNEHRLRREIIATQLSNAIVTDMGVAFVYQMYDETKATAAEIVRAYVIAKEIFNFQAFWQENQALDYKVAPEVQTSMVLEMMRLIRRAVRWLLRNQRPHLDISAIIDLFKPHITKIYKNLANFLVGVEKEYFAAKAQTLRQAEVPETMITRIASARAMYSSLNIIQAATEYDFDISKVAAIYFSLADILELNQFSELINTYPVDTHWAVLARSAIKGDLDLQQRVLTIGVLKINPKARNVSHQIEYWLAMNKSLVDHWLSVLAGLRSNTNLDYAMLAVAMRELFNLAQSSLYNKPDNTTN